MGATRPSPELNILEKGYHIRSYEVDAAGRLSTPSIFNLLQDAASEHALKLGVSVHQLLEKKITWVLSRMILRMESFPGWRDCIRVRTWPSGIQTVFALRDFEILNQKEQAIGRATSAWIIIDADKRRPVRPTAFAEQINSIEGLHALEHPLNKLPRVESAQHQSGFFVRYHDLDINQHVNNVSYVEWLLESTPEFGREDFSLRELELNFLGEAFQGDRIVTKCREEDRSQTTFSHTIVREDDGVELVRGRTLWSRN